MELCPDLVLLANVAEVVSIIRDMRGTDVKLIMEKKLTTSDLSRNLARLSVPQSMILTEQEECRYLENGGEIAVPVIEPCLRISNMTFKTWKMSNPLYVLTRGWNAVAHNQNNGLKEGDLIQLWSFLTEGSVGFAVVKA